MMKTLKEQKEIERLWNGLSFDESNVECSINYKKYKKWIKVTPCWNWDECDYRVCKDK